MLPSDSWGVKMGGGGGGGVSATSILAYALAWGPVNDSGGVSGHWFRLWALSQVA